MGFDMVEKIILEDAVIMEKRGKVCTITLNRPEKMNAWNENIQYGLQEAFNRVASDKSIRVVVLTGAGGNFCAGGDMSYLKKEIAPVTTYNRMKKLGKLVRTIREMPQPVVCKVRGAAYGGGMNIALTGDFVVAAHNARFCEIFVNIGLSFDNGATYYLPRLVGLAKAKEIALLGDEFDGKTAASIGLIYKSFSDEILDREVDALAQKLSEKSLDAMAVLKEGLEKSFNMSLYEAIEWESSHQTIMFQSSEHKEKVREFINSKRK